MAPFDKIPVLLLRALRLGRAVGAGRDTPSALWAGQHQVPMLRVADLRKRSRSVTGKADCAFPKGIQRCRGITGKEPPAASLARGTRVSQAVTPAAPAGSPGLLSGQITPAGEELITLSLLQRPPQAEERNLPGPRGGTNSLEDRELEPDRNVISPTNECIHYEI